MSRIPDPGFDPRIADWLEADPSAAPRDLMKVVESALPSIPQRRVVRLPWRLPPVNRYVLIAAAVGLVALAGVGLLAGGSRPATPQATPMPTPAPAATASSTSAPSATPGPLDNATTTFTSPLYAYSIKVDPGWSIQAATALADDPKASEDEISDLIRPTGTDTAIGVVASSLAGTSFDAWLADVHQGVLDDAGLPDNCKGGDPASWPEKPVGDLPGRQMTLCNFKQVFVEHDGRAYTFTWGNDTFNADEHLDPADFDRLLTTVTFPDASASPAP